MNRRGTVLFVVMGVVAAGALVGSTMLLMAEARTDASAAAVGRLKTRAIAWSGVQAVMSELSAQRDDLLSGLDPDLSDELVLFEHEDGSRSVVRLLPIGPDESLLAPESAKLDINHATAEMLSSLDGISELTGERIVNNRPYGSVHDLIDVDGITAALLYGGGTVNESEDDARIELDFSFGDESPALVDQLTVFAFDPNVVAGFGDDNEPYVGTRRFNLNIAWSEGFASSIEERFGSDADEVVKGILDRGYSFESDADVVRVLLELFSIDDADVWIEILDSVTTTDDEFVLGRVDINRASEEVLAAIPGIDSVVAQQIVDRRERLDAESRRTAVWPVAEGLMSTERFLESANHMAARTLQWRVRLECGIVPPDTGLPAGDEFGVLTDRALGIDLDLQDRIVVEAVIDLSSQRPRVAELYDVTLLDPLRALAARLPAPEPVGLGFEPLATVEGADLDPVPERERTSLDFGELEVVEPMDMGDAPAARAGTLDPMEAVDRRIGRWRYTEERE
jgi:DNA uptake protein ComE-like DNA-binding protein